MSRLVMVLAAGYRLPNVFALLPALPVLSISHDESCAEAAVGTTGPLGG
jgi:hypothetical protein